MNPQLRGCLYLVGFLAFVSVICGLSFVVLPSWGSAVALPIIQVPGETLVVDFLPGWNLTNSFVGTMITNIGVLLVVFILWRVSKGWTQKVPGRAQGMFEVFIQTLYNFLYGLGGERLRKTPMLWPLVATVFFWLLVANYMKLFPGAETVGYLHCAYAGTSGYAASPGWTGGSYQLRVDEPLNAGTSQTAEMEENCLHFFKGKEFERFPAENAAGIEAQIEEAEAELATVQEELNVALAALDEFEANTEGEELTGAQEEQLEELEHAVEEAQLHFAEAERAVQRQQIRLDAATALPIIEAELEAVEAQIAALNGETVEEMEAEEAAEANERERLGEQVLSAARVAANTGPTAETRESIEADLESALAAFESAESDDERVTALESLRSSLETMQDYANTQLVYPTATLIFSESQLDTDAMPFIFHITPYVRGPATDLSLTFALAIVAIVVVQIYGVRELGPSYFEKFIALTSVGNAGKRPLGVIDFVVGVLEIISEIGKPVSLAFRLFGNLFAGGVALMVVTFLVAFIVPGVIMGLELIIGLVQALVFALLIVVYSNMAMEGHHGDEHHDDEHHHDEANHGEAEAAH